MHRTKLAFAFALTAAALTACGDNNDGGGAPAVDDLSVTTDEDTPIMRALEISGGDALTITLGQPMHGTVAQSSGTFTYTPEPNYNGSDSFTVTVADGGREDTATVSITITPVNDTPTGVGDSFATNEDAAHEAELTALLANDTDPDGDTLTVTAVGNATNGTVALTATDVVFTPTANFTGTGMYRYTVSDGTATSDVMVSITVGGVNDAPVAIDDARTTAEDTNLVVTAASLATNDTDAEGQTLTVTAVTAVTGGTVALAGGNVTFTPTLNFNGAASYTYTVSDGALTDTGTVNVTVTAVNDAPVATDDNASTAEDTAITVLQSTMIANDTDVDSGTTLTVTGVANVVGGTVTLSGGDATFTPTTNFTGAGSFEYTLSDGTLTDTGLVTINVGTSNDAPVAVDDTRMTNEDVALVLASSSLVANDIDIDGDTLTVTSVSSAVNGTVSLDVSGQITFTPTLNFNGMASFNYVVTDGALNDTGTVNIAVMAVNDAPVANPDSATAQTTVATNFQASAFLANDTDVDGNPLTITAVSNASNGATVSLSGTTITFTSAAAFVGNATFDYTLSDGAGGTATGTVTVNVVLVVTCGDGVVVGAETCDDGDTDPGDGCDGNCQRETGYTCTGSPSVCVTTCGDGIIAGIEACDDADTDPGDGCNGSCQTENGFTCTGQPSTCVTTCGDGTTAGTEECDDMNPTEGDGCDTNCTVTACGNGIVTTGEVCDDDNTTSGDGCDANCTPTGCGNGVVTGTEVCDDGNPTNGDGCDSNCTVTGCNNGIVTAGEACDDGDPDNTDGCTTQCVVGVICTATDFANGDRFANDPATGNCYVSFDSDTLSYAAAQSVCTAAGGYLATITSAPEQAVVASVQNTAQNPWIGGDDSVVEGTFRWLTGEAFTFMKFAAGQPDDDVGLGGSGDCLHLVNAAGEWNDTNCALTTFVVGEICEFELVPCGDGVLQTSEGESCDDGNQTAGDGCSATCTLENLVRFSFTGALGSEAMVAADSTAAGLAATPTMSRGAGLTPSAAGNAFSANAFATTATLDATDFYAFTVTPSASMTLVALELDERRSLTGIRQWSIRSSLDGFATDLGAFSVPDNDLTRVNQLVLLGAAFQNLTAAVEFRIYGFAAEASTGTWRIDNVELAGFTTP